MFKVNNFPDHWDVVEFESIEELFNGVRYNETQEYCFGLNFVTNFTQKVKKHEKPQYFLDIQFSYNKGFVVDTNSPPFDEHVMSPDIASWGNWQQPGVTALFPYLTEFMARYVGLFINKDIEDPEAYMSSTQPLFYQSISYAPMKT